MAEPFQRLTAAEARSLVEAHQLGLDRMGSVLEPLYEEIRDCASVGMTATERTLAMVCPRDQLATVIQCLRDDGFIVDVDAGVMTVHWGRAV